MTRSRVFSLALSLTLFARPKAKYSERIFRRPAHGHEVVRRAFFVY